MCYGLIPWQRQINTEIVAKRICNGLFICIMNNICLDNAIKVFKLVILDVIYALAFCNIKKDLNLITFNSRELGVVSAYRKGHLKLNR